MTAPGVAAQDAFHSQVAAFEWAISGNGLYAILATGRGIAAGAGQVRRYEQLVPAYKYDKEP
jgi:hypothetical protein